MDAVNENTEVSESARRLWCVLLDAHALSPDEAMADRVAANRVPCAVRNVIDLALELTRIDVAVLATCGTRGSSRAGKGRYIESDPALIRAYGESQHQRAIAIHGRGKAFTDLADRIDARRAVDSAGQRRLFA